MQATIKVKSVRRDHAPFSNGETMREIVVFETDGPTGNDFFLVEDMSITLTKVGPQALLEPGQKLKITIEAV